MSFLRHVTCLWGIVKYGFCTWNPINQVIDENVIAIYFVFSLKHCLQEKCINIYWSVVTCNLPVYV